MQSHLLSALRAQHQQIRSRWTALLHVEPVSTPLANPNALVHLLDWTLEEIYRGLGTLAARRNRIARAAAIRCSLTLPPVNKRCRKR